MWSDRETTQDCLGFEAYVESLAAICLEPDIAPLTLGIFGSWGSGKTSLMKMLEVKVKETDKVVTVWANAWRYEGKDEAQSALIHAIIENLSKEKTLTTEAKECVKRIVNGASILKLSKFLGKTLLTMTPNISDFFDCFSDESAKLAKTMAEFENDFVDLLKKVEIDRIVVFIDDLDRCQSTKIIETFETIKLFLNIPECTFVIGADSLKIEYAIKEYYKIDSRNQETDSRSGRSFADDYLEKIIQIPFRIPEQSLNDIACYVGMLTLRSVLKTEAWPELIRDRHSIVGNHTSVHEGFVDWISSKSDGIHQFAKAITITALNQCLQHVSILSQGLRGNPRQIKRFLNILELRKRLAQSNKLIIGEDILVKILVLEYTWNWFFQEIAENYDTSAQKSELLFELDKLFKEGKQDDPDSPVLTQALTTLGLNEFLQNEPSLTGVDLTPYLFLAQTSLKVRKSSLTPPDEAVKSLVERIADIDRIRSKSASREATKTDKVMISSLIRALTNRLLIETDSRIQVHILNGISTICSSNQDVLQITVDGLKNIDTKANQALSIAILPILELAEKHGIDVSDLRERTRNSSPITKALDSRSRNVSPSSKKV